MTPRAFGESAGPRVFPFAVLREVSQRQVLRLMRSRAKWASSWLPLSGSSGMGFAAARVSPLSGAGALPRVLEGQPPGEAKGGDRIEEGDEKAAHPVREALVGVAGSPPHGLWAPDRLGVPQACFCCLSGLSPAVEGAGWVDLLRVAGFSSARSSRF
jgi:hypothetical protein